MFTIKILKNARVKNPSHRKPHYLKHDDIVYKIIRVARETGLSLIKYDESNDTPTLMIFDKTMKGD